MCDHLSCLHILLISQKSFCALVCLCSRYILRTVVNEQAFLISKVWSTFPLLHASYFTEIFLCFGLHVLIVNFKKSTTSFSVSILCVVLEILKCGQLSQYVSYFTKVFFRLCLCMLCLKLESSTICASMWPQTAKGSTWISRLFEGCSHSKSPCRVFSSSVVA